METKDISKKVIQDYLALRGVQEAMIFGVEHERVDPIDRYVFMKNMYENLTGYRMTSEGMQVPTPDIDNVPVYVDMYDFDEIKTIDDAVVNMKFLSYAKEPYQQVAMRKLAKLREENRNKRELER